MESYVYFTNVKLFDFVNYYIKCKQTKKWNKKEGT